MNLRVQMSKSEPLVGVYNELCTDHERETHVWVCEKQDLRYLVLVLCLEAPNHSRIPMAANALSSTIAIVYRLNFMFTLSAVITNVSHLASADTSPPFSLLHLGHRAASRDAYGQGWASVCNPPWCFLLLLWEHCVWHRY